MLNYDIAVEVQFSSLQVTLQGTNVLRGYGYVFRIVADNCGCSTAIGTKCSQSRIGA